MSSVNVDIALMAVLGECKGKRVLLSLIFSRSEALQNIRYLDNALRYLIFLSGPKWSVRKIGRLGFLDFVPGFIANHHKRGG